LPPSCGGPLPSISGEVRQKSKSEWFLSRPEWFLSTPATDLSPRKSGVATGASNLINPFLNVRKTTRSEEVTGDVGGSAGDRPRRFRKFNIEIDRIWPIRLAPRQVIEWPEKWGDALIIQCQECGYKMRWDIASGKMYYPSPGNSNCKNIVASIDIHGSTKLVQQDCQFLDQAKQAAQSRWRG
jgi:hypothetical protein